MTSFDRTAEQILTEIDVDAHIQMSVRAKSLPAMGLERTGQAFDYLFLTQDALCFLQPNPAPPMLVRLPLTSLTSLEWNGQNLFPEAESGTEVDIAEAVKGWGTQIKRVTGERSSAQKFFELWTRWALKPSHLGFVQAVATAAGLARQDDPEVGITTWNRISTSPDARTGGAAVGKVPDGVTTDDDRPSPEPEGVAPSVVNLSYAGVTDLIRQQWLVEVVDDTIMRALNLTIMDWDDADLARILIDGKLDPERCRKVMDDHLDTQDEVDDGLFELRVSEFGLPYGVKNPDR